MTRTLTLAAVALGLLVPSLALAQGNPTNPGDFINNPHPMMPWFGVATPNRIVYGTVLRYIEVPARAVVIDLAVVNGGVPGATRPHVVEVPGYTIAETTTGFYYPPRWTLIQTNVGVYQWHLAPAAFQYRS
jgi:hypothetical protein